MNLKNKTIVITGGSSGVGLEIVKYLAPDNLIIVVASRKNLKEQMRKIDSKIACYVCDLAKKTEVEDVADSIIKNYTSIDILINCAAVQNTPEFIDNNFSYESIEREIEINFTSICRLSYLLLPALVKDTPSFILNINSGLALAPKKNSAVYCATKAALASFSISLMYQLEKTNVQVLQAFLPLIDTPMTAGRGSQKMSASIAASKIIKGLRDEKKINDLGKVKLLRWLMRLSPSTAFNMMKRR